LGPSGALENVDNARKPKDPAGAESVEMLEPSEGLRLEHLQEPSDLRVSLRERALDAQTEDDRTYTGCLGAWIWERWRSALEPAGLSREAFMEIVTGYRRELWFWLLGDREWDPLVIGLAGRVWRRLPSA
jgi:hypothetical protein